ARGFSLLSVSIQSKLAAIAVNIKRIASIVSSLYFDNFCIFANTGFSNLNLKNYYIFR
ncbi:MAG: IS5/IS1182 family transposase, partial [Gudongella sp.]|nr:IS5/IS1182 family transposase [Gudongella sp.]